MTPLRAFLVLCVCLAINSAAAQYQFGQATWYEAISNGFCGFGSNIPRNGFVGALPFIETARNGAGFWQPPETNACNNLCYEVSCVPQFVESADGSIYLDRRDACEDPDRAVIIQIVDECRCSLPSFPGGPRGNFQWCCNIPTPRLGINRHIDLSKQAFTALVKDGNFNLGILGIRWRKVPCRNIGIISLSTSAPEPPRNVTRPNQTSQRPPAIPSNMTWHDISHTGNDILKEFEQCGGKGGFCQTLFGACVDAPAQQAKCKSGLTCQRQNEFYYQCLPATAVQNPSVPASNGSTGNSSSGSRPPVVATNGPTAGKAKILEKDAQCGGCGAACKDIAKCVDDQFPGFACGSGLKCIRQNAYYWQCLDANAIKNLNSQWSIIKPEPTKACPRFLSTGMQCGGKGGKCATEFGGKCEDRVAQGVCCERGLSCVRQNEWYYGCQ